MYQGEGEGERRAGQGRTVGSADRQHRGTNCNHISKDNHNDTSHAVYGWMKRVIVADDGVGDDDDDARNTIQCIAVAGYN